MKVLLHPTYFPTISSFSAMLNSDEICFERFDSYQKQTLRNRTHIYAANGRLQLNIPVNHSQKDRQFYKDVQIAYDQNWQLNHRRSIESAYRSSPFFEFYEDEILPIYNQNEKFLFDFNIKTIETIFKSLSVDFKYEYTEDYLSETLVYDDYRDLVSAKKEVDADFKPYIQVFESKHGFIKNLSILDLLFNQGPNSLAYLKD